MVMGFNKVVIAIWSIMTGYDAACILHVLALACPCGRRGGTLSPPTQPGSKASAALWHSSSGESG